jgi:hypothetical protein
MGVKIPQLVKFRFTDYTELRKCEYKLKWICCRLINTIKLVIFVGFIINFRGSL